MIVQEIITIDDKQFKHTFSDANYYIQKEGTEEEYIEAFDVPTSTFTYVETDKQVPHEDKDELKLTRGDVFRGILQAKGVTRAQLRAFIEAMPETTTEEKLAKELALIDFDEALYFYRRNPLIDKVGAQLDITNYQMTRFFETNDYHTLIK
jgi:hypothetical protein